MRNQSTNHAATIALFGGFVLPENSTNSNGDITMPVNWPEVSKVIDNLAELKVVQMVLWVTWGNGQPDALMPLTIEDFMECTGLSRQSVRTGIDKAIEHGYILREIEYNTEDGRVCQSRFYGIKISQVQDQDLAFDRECDQDLDVEQEVSFSDETALEADFYQEQNVSHSSNELERNTHSYISVDTSRIQEENNNLDSGKNTRPCDRLQMLSRDDNATLCNRIESFSSDLGDLEHTASNIGQTRRILARYLASGGDFEAFLLLMQQAKEITQRKTSIRHTNSKKQRNAMPYYFACLKRACKESKDQIAA